MKKTLLVLFALVAMSLSNVWAYDFSAVAPSGQTLYYNIVRGKAQVTYKHASAPSYTDLSGALVIPSSVEHNGTTYPVAAIESYAFNGCNGLAEVTIPNSVTAIGSYAFPNCSNLTSVILPATLTAIEAGTFSGCSSLASMAFPASLTAIGERAFQNCSSLAGAALPASVTTIGEGAFNGCNGLAEVTLPASVTTIGEGAFSGCGSLTEVTIPASVTLIRDRVFASCVGLASVTIPASVTYIGEGAFASCNSLASVTIPASVTFICNGAFQYCSSLASIYSLAATPPTIGGSRAFEGVDKTIPLYVPAMSAPLYATASVWSDFNTIVGIATQGIDEVDGMSVESMAGAIVVGGAAGQSVTIFDIAGRVIVREQAVEGKTYTMPRNGVYLVKVGNHPAEKVVVVR